MNQSQPVTELETTGDDAALDFLNRLGEQEEKEQVKPEAKTDESGQDAEEDQGEEQPNNEPDPLEWLQKTHKVSIQGQEVEISADEAFKGYMRDADYRQKTAHAAELTRQAEQERQALRQERETRVNQLEVLGGVLQMELAGDKARLAEMLDTDPVGYLRMREHIEQKEAMLQQAAHAWRDAKDAEQAEAAKETERWLNEQKRLIREKVPEWRDPKVRDAEAAAMGEYLVKIGYAPEEQQALTDHRAMLIVRDAMRWQKQQEIKQQKAPQQPSKTATPGNRNNPSQASERADDLARRARKTHNTDDILAYLNSKGN